MKKAKSRRTVLIGIVHLAAKECGLDEDARRDLMQRVTGKRSAKECTDADLEKFVRTLKQTYGWEQRPSKRKAQAVSYQQRMIRALWSSLAALDALGNPSDEALMRFVQRVTKNKGPLPIEGLRFLSHAEASSVIEALKGWLEREGVSWHVSERSPLLRYIPASRLPVIRALLTRYTEMRLESLTLILEQLLGIKDLSDRPEPKVTAEECDRLIKILGERLRARADDAAIAELDAENG